MSPYLPMPVWHARPAVRLLPALATLLAATTTPHGLAQAAPSGEARLQWESRPANTIGPLAAALALQPGLAPVSAQMPVTQLELRHSLRLPLPASAPRTSLQGEVLLRHAWPQVMPAG